MKLIEFRTTGGPQRQALVEFHIGKEYVYNRYNQLVRFIKTTPKGYNFVYKSKGCLIRTSSFLRPTGSPKLTRRQQEGLDPVSILIPEITFDLFKTIVDNQLASTMLCGIEIGYGEAIEGDDFIIWSDEVGKKRIRFGDKEWVLKIPENVTLNLEAKIVRQRLLIDEKAKENADLRAELAGANNIINNFKQYAERILKW